jgi:hypothetical protein
LDAVTDAAAAPVIAKYTGVLGAADVFTTQHDIVGAGVNPARRRCRNPGSPLIEIAHEAVR